MLVLTTVCISCVFEHEQGATLWKADEALTWDMPSREFLGWAVVR